MEVAVSAASWVLGKALGPVTDSLLEAWANSVGLGPNMEALKMELLYAQGLLDNAEGREIRSPALKELLHRLRQLAYNADDVLGELEYFRIQDALDGTNDAADAKSLFLNARHTARDAVAKLKPSSDSRDTEHDEQDNNAKQGCFSSMCLSGGRTLSSAPPSPNNQDDQKVNGDGNGRKFFHGASLSKVQGRLSGAFLCGKREMSSSPPSPTNTAKSIGKRLLCCSSQSVDDDARTIMSENSNMLGNTASQATKLMFNRVEISAKMKDITEHLKPICAKVSNILNLEFMGTNRTTRKDIAKKRPITTSEITEDKLYGRDTQKNKIVDGITHGEYFANELVVLPIVGPGGIGKTTFTQHVCKEVKRHFDVCIWLCVSLDFNASRLTQDAVKQIPKVDGEKEKIPKVDGEKEQIPKVDGEKEQSPKVDGEKENSSDQEIEQRLKSKRFLLVLDDMWTYDEYEWKKLLAPLGRGGQKGSLVIVTTRIPEVARNIKTVDCWIELGRLEPEDFKCFFETCIFGGQKPWEGDTEKLCDVGKEIMSKLKRFPLEAKTVGRLLRNQLTLEHWTKVLESKEWELQTNKDNIMPALKLSYDYLPFHLQQCFYYCGLFPEDYEFESEELVHFWIGLDIVHPCDLNRRIEDVGMGYLEDLVDHGFFKKNKRNGGCPYYVIHDLLHDLAINISSFECLSIHSTNVKSMQIPQDVRHLSVIVDNKDVEDIKTFKYYKSDLIALDKRLKVENLRTLMVFGGHHGSFVKTFRDLFEKARALRAIYLSGASYNVEDMLYNISKLIHLRYLKINNSEYMVKINNSEYMENTGWPIALSRLYHLEVIDIQKFKGPCTFPRHMNNLAKLRHFLVPEDKFQFHSNIAEVGKLKLLQELKSFEVGKESKGFELSQLGQLSGLGGSLAICSLERIRTMEEAREARLGQIKRLQKLTLEWAGQPEKDTANEENALEILMPHSYLQDLCIRGHGGTKCPPWLRENLSVKNLESLHLDGVAWIIFPPIGELWLVNGPHGEIPSDICDQKFQNLKTLELVNLPRLKKWVVDASCQSFAHLEVLIIKDCSKLTELSFAHSSQREKDKEALPCLRKLEIKKCPELVSFPPIPWTSDPSCCAEISGIASGLDELACGKEFTSEYTLRIRGAIHRDSTFWNVLVFGNLSELERLEIDSCPPLPLHHFRMLSSLKTLELRRSSSIIFPSVEGESRAKYECPVECMTITEWGASAKELTQLITCFPKLSKLIVQGCEKITELGVVEKQATATKTRGAEAEGTYFPKLSKLAVWVCEKITKLGVVEKQATATTTKVDDPEIAAEAEGLLLVPSQLQRLAIYYCPQLILRSDPGQGLTSLRSLAIVDCPRFLSSYSSSSPCFPFPASLEHLTLAGAVGTATLPPSNLTSLSDLSISYCEDLRGDGLGPFPALFRIPTSSDRNTPNSFAGSESSPPHEPELPSYSSKLQRLETDDVAGVLAAPICAFLSSSLTELHFSSVKEVERFTKKQEEALQLLTSLERIKFWFCDTLQCLPAGLHRLANLKKLDIHYCAAIRSLPKDGLPSFLQELGIYSCPAIRSIPKECLPNSLQKLEIRYCPAIRSLPKVDDLPSSLQKLDVSNSNSEELRRHCRKLIGTIPIVRV